MRVISEVFKQVKFSTKIGMLLAFAAAPAARGDCIELTSGKIEYEVTGCQMVDTEGLFSTPESRERFYKEVPFAQAKEILASYKGLILEGKVIASQAVAKGAKTRSKALLGEDPSLFVGPPLMHDCAFFSGKRVAGTVRQNCCDGHLEVPCLTKTSYTLLLAGPARGRLDSRAKSKAKAKSP